MIKRWVGKLLERLVLVPAFFILMAAAAAGSQAQTLPSDGAPAAPAGIAHAFEIEIQAPKPVQDYLLRHLELLRYQSLTDLDASELARLVGMAEPNVRELMGTLGYFSPDIHLELRETPDNPRSPRLVVITVQPGEPVRVSGVTFEFTGPIATDEAAAAQRRAIQAGWLLGAGMTFTQAAWDAAKTQALRELTTRRYPAGRLSSTRADIDPETKTARLSVTLDSGPLYRLGALQISGTQRYGSDLVQRLARLAPGADYDQTRLVEAQRRLTDSGYFDSAVVSLDTTGDPAAAPVLVQVREAKLKKIVLGIGASTDSGARLSVEHTNHQLPGIGWRAVSKLSLDRVTKSIGTELTAPPDDANWRWVTSALVQREESGSFEVTSQRLRAGRTQSGERIDRSYYLQYDRAQPNNVGAATTAEALSANYAWTQRNFDALPFPSRGYGLGVELGGGVTLGADRQPFVRTDIRWLGYVPLASSKDGTPASMRAGRIELRAEGGAVLAREQANLPSTQLFLTGGGTTVRGYDYRSIGSVLPNGQTAAGRYLAVGSVEWQHPITVNDRLTDWESTVFVDAGAVADKPAELRGKVGIGAGVRWKSPVGPLQMDLAYGVAVRRLRLHLSVGFTF
ncbi:autotransporter assembly complex protein TamA [Rhodoferax sediminis]|nr:autotransporter assembly complex family protein [Rhodoferax sediminis]